MDEDTFDEKVDELYHNTYEEKIKNFRQEIIDAINKRLDAFGADLDIEKFERIDDEYCLGFGIGNLDINILIVQSNVRDGSLDGINFRLEMIKHEGGEHKLVGAITPYNLTDEVWVDVEDEWAIKDRWEDFVAAACIQDREVLSNLMEEGKEL